MQRGLGVRRDTKLRKDAFEAHAARLIFTGKIFQQSEALPPCRSWVQIQIADVDLEMRF